MNNGYCHLVQNLGGELYLGTRDVAYAYSHILGAEVEVEAGHGWFVLSPRDSCTLTIRPVARTTTAKKMCAVYDDDHYVALLAGSSNVRTYVDGGLLKSECVGRGAKVILVACPTVVARQHIREAQQHLGIPSPNRSDARLRRSYMFMLGLSEQTVDEAIKYAKAGGFGGIMLLRDHWLMNQGHWDIHKWLWPGELLQRAVARMHDAGLYVGAHIFGVGVSPNDTFAAAEGIIGKSKYGTLYVDLDHPLAEQVYGRFGELVRHVGFDMLYVDAADGEPNWQYVNRVHRRIWDSINKPDLIYQTSIGVGQSFLWHQCTRAASADGVTDIRRYLDQRWPLILSYLDDWTVPDVGWYFWMDNQVSVDDMLYVAKKAVSVGSFSLETRLDYLQTRPGTDELMRRLNTLGTEPSEQP